MTLSAPSTRIVQPARRPGRVHPDDMEARTAAGRAAHWFEARLLDMAHGLGLFYRAHDRATLFDADCDQRVDRAIAALDAGNGLEARALLLEYRERDALRDLEHAAARGFIEGIVHVAIRQLGGWIERAAVAVRGRS
jgi:hypothetical protein